MPNAISNLDDQIDSRDVIARIEELEAELVELEEAVSEFPEYCLNVWLDVWLDVWLASLEEEYQELAALKKLAEQGENSADDWQYGAQLIHEDYFETAMDDMVADCYELPKDLPFWMTITYDYDALKQDYTELDFDGQTYYVR